MKNSGKKVWLCWKKMGWNFSRTIWLGTTGDQYVHINGYTYYLNDLLSKVDFYNIETSMCVCW